MKINVSDEGLAVLAQSGDKRAAEMLLNKYKGLVLARCSRYFMVGATDEDIVQEGMIGLYRAIMCFNKEKNDSFASFASMCIKRRVLSALQSANRKKNMPLNTCISLNKPVDDTGEKTLGDVIENTQFDPEKLFINKEKRKSQRMRIENQLSKLEKQIVMRYLDGESYDEIAKKLNITKKSVDNAMQRIRSKLQR